ncbi:MAG: SecY family transport protein, partial [Planctomycetes bacterium]|nr:SecY family transport protein [Planctomycetota bacterium]
RLNIYRLMVIPDDASPPGSWVPAVAWRSLSIMSLGVQPFVAAMVLGLLARKAFPGFAARIEARGGWGALESWARRAAIPVALIQGWFVMGHVNGLGKSGLVPGADFLSFILPNLALMLAGTAIAVWIARQIDRRGLGSGALTLVAFDGIAHLAREARAIPEILRRTLDGRVPFLMHTLAALALFALVATLYRASLKIPLVRPTGPESPLELGFCPAGAWPILAAVVGSELPRSLWLMAGPWAQALVLGDRELATLLGYVGVVFVVAFASADVGNSARRAAELLKTGGLAIAGIPPGRRTWRFLANAAFRLAIVGAVAQAVLLALASVVSKWWSTDTGTGHTSGRFVFLLAAAAVSAWIGPVAKALRHDPNPTVSFPNPPPVA